MKDDRLYLIYIQECLARIEAYTAEGKEAFLADTKTQDAVLRNCKPWPSPRGGYRNPLRVNGRISIGKPSPPFGTVRFIITRVSTSKGFGTSSSATCLSSKPELRPSYKRYGKSHEARLRIR